VPIYLVVNSDASQAVIFKMARYQGRIASVIQLPDLSEPVSQKI